MTDPKRPSATPCPQGRTDYDACFAPFRYCPEIRDNPINEETLDPHARWVFHKIHRVIWRHAFTDHDCQTTRCKAMMLAESSELRDVIVEAYERGKRDARGEPWRAGEYGDV